MEQDSQHNQEEQIDIIEILFTILSQRFLIISSLIIFIFLGIMYNYYHQDIFKTNSNGNDSFVKSSLAFHLFFLKYL